MRPTLLCSLVLGAAGAVALALWPAAAAQPKPEQKQEGKDEQPQPQPQPRPQEGRPATQLPIAQVVLFSSGVGYFQREGTVEGNARVDLTFDVRDINDLIKSRVLRDLDGGVVTAVSYDSNAPVERTLKSFAINLNGNPSFSAILNQARGEKVEVVLQQTNATQPGTLTGTVIGIQHKKQTAGKEGVEAGLLN